MKRALARLGWTFLAAVMAWMAVVGMGAPHELFVEYWYLVIGVLTVVGFALMAVIDWQVDREVSRWNK